MNTLANNKEFLKYTEIWNKIVDLFNEKHHKRGLYNNPVHNNKYITKINQFYGNFNDNKKLQKMNIMVIQCH